MSRHPNLTKAAEQLPGRMDRLVDAVRRYANAERSAQRMVSLCTEHHTPASWMPTSGYVSISPRA